MVQFLTVLLKVKNCLNLSQIFVTYQLCGYIVSKTVDESKALLKFKFLLRTFCQMFYLIQLETSRKQSIFLKLKLLFSY